MKNLKIGAKIFLGFFCMFALLFAISAISVSAFFYTGSNISEVDEFDGFQARANELMHILNETRITSRELYQSQNIVQFKNISKQIMYCDFKINKLHEYMAESPRLDIFEGDIADFEALYVKWRSNINKLGADFNLEEPLNETDKAAFDVIAADSTRIGLLAHEILSNTINDIVDTSHKHILSAKSFNQLALIIVIVISVISLFAGIIMASVIRLSITRPVSYMREILNRIGEAGDMELSEETREQLEKVTSGKDEMAQCVTALLTLLTRLNSVDETLQNVADGDLSVKIKLQSERDTIGLAVQKMLGDLNQKFETISNSTNWVNREAGALSDGSQMLADGARAQTESIGNLSESVQRVSQKTVKNTELARQATDLINTIQENAKAGTEKMNQMIQAAADINTASQAIGKVIKVIDDIAFQTNILALNAAVEAARAGQHGKGFAVVADEVRSLATKSAEAAQNTGVLIEDTIKKAAMGTTIAEVTSHSLEKIVQGVVQSNSIISDMSLLSQEQSTDIQQIIADVSQVDKVVAQNSTIASQSADAASEISTQSNLLQELVGQFRLVNGAGALTDGRDNR